MNRKALLAAVALLAVGVSLWFWRGRAAKPAGSAEVAAQTVPPPGEAIKLSAPTDDGQRGDRGGDDGYLIDDDPRGSLRLEGQVISELDEGVGGALVALDSNPPRVTKSEADGSFFFDGLVPREYELVARAESAVAGPVTARLHESTDPVILRLKAGAKLLVTVVDAGERRALGGATVELRGIDTQTATADERGVATFAPVAFDGYEVVASAPGFAPEHEYLRIRGELHQVELGLKHGAAVHGVVVSPDGVPVAGARVLYSGASDWGQQADPRRDAVTTDAKGEFSFAALPAGTFRFTARHEAFAPGSSELTTLDGKSPTKDVKIALEAAAVLRGKVVTTEGAPVPSATVRVGVSSAGMVRSRPRQAFTDELGAFVLTGLPRKPLEVVAVHDSGSSEMADADVSIPPFEAEVTLELDVTGKIAGIVVSSSGEPVEGAQVNAWPDFRRGGEFDRATMRLRGFPSELTDAGGRFEFAGLTPGPYTVSASHPQTRGGGGFFGRRGRGRRGEGTEAQVGDLQLKITVETPGSVTGKVLLKDGNAPALFTVSVGGFGGGDPFSTKDGTFTIKDLEPGDYDLTVRGLEFDTKQVSGVKIEEGKPTDVGTITVLQGRAIAGQVTANGRPVQGAVVRVGRQLFGDGSSSKASRGGPPGTRNAKETTTDENGAFRISGLAEAEVSLVAEHDTHGRSLAIRIPRSSESTKNLQVPLLAFGALEGKVSKDGQPSDGVIINAASVDDSTVSYGVASGADGRFRFDRLAPDTYKVSAMTGRMMRGMSFFSKAVVVPVGGVAQVDLTVVQGTAGVEVTLKPTNSDSLNFAMVYAIAGEFATPPSWARLNDALGRLTDRHSTFAFSIMGRAVELEELYAEPYTVCAIPYPKEIEGMSATMEYGEREGDRLPVYCDRVDLTDGGTDHKLTLEVTLPTLAGGTSP